MSFPELNDPELAIPGLDRTQVLRYCAVSGGGTRSASASLGVDACIAPTRLDRAGSIHRLEFRRQLARRAVHVSPGFHSMKKTFLGTYIPPSQLNDDNLKPDGTHPQAFETAIHDATTFDQVLELGRGDEAYSDIVGSIFLEPFGLHDNEKFFTFHRGALKGVLSGNPSMSQDNFIVVEREDRPYLIVTGVMLGQQTSEDPNEYYPVEMTPLYTGVRNRFELEKDGETVVVGGGYVESFGYDSYEPQNGPKNGRWEVRSDGTADSRRQTLR